MSKLKVAVTGHNGRLGSYLTGKLGYVPMDCDITDPGSISAKVKEISPDVIINCAAYTDVDGAESEYTEVLKINQTGVQFLRDAFEGWLIQMSTDYIFGGVRGPYSEKASIEDDFASGKYGRSKAYGEMFVLNYPDRFGTIIRTTMLYGVPGFPDFVSSILSQLEKGEKFTVPYMLVGSPTYIPHLAEAIEVLIDKHWQRPPQIVNIAGSDVLSRYEFALMIASVWGHDKDLIAPIRKTHGKAPRPFHAGLTTGYARKMKLPIYSALEGLEEMKRNA